MEQLRRENESLRERCCQLEEQLENASFNMRVLVNTVNEELKRKDLLIEEATRKRP